MADTDVAIENVLFIDPTFTSKLTNIKRQTQVIIIICSHAYIHVHLCIVVLPLKVRVVFPHSCMDRCSRQTYTLDPGETVSGKMRVIISATASVINILTSWSTNDKTSLITDCPINSNDRLFITWTARPYLKVTYF